MQCQMSNVRRKVLGVLGQVSGLGRWQREVREVTDGSKESGARNKESGARCKEQGVRSQVQGARSQEPGARGKESGASRNEGDRNES